MALVSGGAQPPSPRSFVTKVFLANRGHGSEAMVRMGPENIPEL